LLNNAGTDLTLFDRLTAKLIETIGVNLRDLWNDSQKQEISFKRPTKNHLAGRYDLDPIYILKVISLIRDKRDITANIPSCTGKDLKCLHDRYEGLSNPKKEFLEDWKQATKYIAKTLDDMKNYYGVYSKKYIPYTPMIVTIASIKWWF